MNVKYAQSSKQGYSRNQVMHCVRLLLRPVAKFCLKHGVKIQDIIECLKLELSYVTSEELKRKNDKVNVSRISAVTGMHRRDVGRIDKGDYKLNEVKDLATRIITLWQTTAAYTTQSLKPRVLSFAGEHSDFASLVKHAGTDLSIATVLFELERLGLVEHKNNKVRLVRRNLIEREDITEGFHIVADDIESLTDTVEYNILSGEDLPQHHLRTYFDRVREKDLPTINKWLLKAGHKFHLQVREFLAKFDQDSNPDLNYKGKYTKVSLSSFSNMQQEEEGDVQK